MCSMLSTAARVAVESAASVRGIRKEASLPIIGITKRTIPGTEVRITPLLEDIDDLVEAGADIIAYDATQRPRPVATDQIVERIRTAGAIAMADCARVEDGRQALAEGAHILGTTLSGYAYEILPDRAPPDLDLVSEFAKMDTFVIAEGRIRAPGEAAAAIRHGADSVVVGSAITRIEHITSWFSDGIEDAFTGSGETTDG